MSDSPVREPRSIPVVLALVTDLMFSSRIREEATRAGGACETVGTAEDFLAAVRRAPPALAIVDLAGHSFDALEALRRLKGDPVTAAVRTVAFGSHVDVDRMDAARAAGSDEVLPRSLFTRDLALIVGRALAARPGGT